MFDENTLIIFFIGCAVGGVLTCIICKCCC